MSVAGRNGGRDSCPRTLTTLVRVVSLCTFALLLACRQSGLRSTEVSEGPRFALQSGKEVAVVGVGCQKGESGDLTLYVDYLSDLSLRDYPALTRAVVEVWAEFRGLAEARGARTLMIRAYDGARRGQPVVFGFLREADGSWQKPDVLTLRGGKQVVVLRKTAERGQLFIDYATNTPIRDVCALGPEVDDVWSAFRSFAEQSGASKVFVSPSEAPVGGGSISFAITRKPDGSWSRQELCARTDAGPR